MPEPITLVAVGSGFAGVLVHLARRYFELAKEVLDIVLGLIALIISLPVLAVCAIIIKVSSKGPVFLTQTRVGKGGKPFKMCKLRTMYSHAETSSGPVWATEGDPRVVPTCRWMRRSHVDELPQLINVIKGEMSLVGPRPERPEIVAELEKVCPEFQRRLVVRPGITGLAQIRNGYDASIDGVRRKLDYDLEYISHRSWLMELRILARTLTKLNDTQSR